MKKMWRSLLSVILVISITAVSSLQALAAGTSSTGQEYVSEIKMAICTSLSYAKQELKGYTVVESDLNENQGNGAQSVYLGYKTTKNRDEAITDLRMMDMNGGYSYNDYDKALEKMAKDITEEINSFFDAIKEFQQNKKDDKYNAKYAYQKMNKFKDDDQNNMLLGDVLSDENVTAEKLQTIFLQGNSSYILALEEFLAVGCADNWIERLEENAKTVYDADAYVLEPYCETIRKQWSSFYNGLSKYNEQLESDDGINLYDATPEDFQAWLESNPSDTNKYYVYNFGFAYHALDSYSYKGGTLLDYFMVPLEDVDYEYLYPIADAMTKGQLQTLPYVQLNKAICYAETNMEAFSTVVSQYRDIIDQSALNAINDKITDEDQKLELPKTDTVSIYAGVDRSLFIEGDGIALTDDAIRKASNSDDASAILQVLNNAKWFLVAEVAVGSIITALAGFYYSAAAAELAAAKTAEIVSAFSQYSGLVVDAVSDASTIVMDVGLGTQGLASNNTMTAVDQLVVFNNAPNTMLASGVVMGVAVGLTLILMGFSIYRGYAKYMNPEYKTVPRAIVDRKTIDVLDSYNNKVGTKDLYFAYYPVKDATPDGEHGNYADMNGWKAQQWNVMYYSKDKRAGQPILANTFVVQFASSQKPKGYTPFCEFGLTAAADINKHAFKEVSGIYLFYKTAEPQTTSVGLGSIVVKGYYALTAFVGLAVGIGATLGIGAVVIKKKRKKNLPVEE